jgi:hypothetical protein
MQQFQINTCACDFVLLGHDMDHMASPDARRPLQELKEIREPATNMCVMMTRKCKRNICADGASSAGDCACTDRALGEHVGSDGESKVVKLVVVQARSTTCMHLYVYVYVHVYVYAYARVSVCMCMRGCACEYMRASICW